MRGVFKPRQITKAEPDNNHLFRNRSGASCEFKVELSQTCKGFEQSLQIGYELAGDGLCDKKGFPKDRLALAWLFEISESNLPRWMSVFGFVLRKQAKKAHAKGIEKDLLKKYVKF